MNKPSVTPDEPRSLNKERLRQCNEAQVVCGMEIVRGLSFWDPYPDEC
jgi:hypothetical protein